MDKLKCTFYYVDVTRIITILEENIKDIKAKNVRERSEILIHRQYVMIALVNRFRKKSYSMTPQDHANMIFDLREVLTLKYALFEKIITPGLRLVFDRVDKYVHPAIQLEL